MATMMSSKTFTGTSLQGQQRSGRVSRAGTVQTHALLGKIKKDDKKTVERAKKSQVVQQKKLLPYDVKWAKTQPERGAKQDNARNTPREGGFGQGKPYQKRKIGSKMEGTPVPSNIDPLLFVGALAGFTLVVVGGLVLGS